MKRLIITSIVLLAGISGEAMAVDCSASTRIPNGTAGGALATLIQGKTVCAMLGSDKWQEFHSGASEGANNLIDWKMGSGHAVDPTGPVGSWSTSGTGNSSRVKYNYGSGGLFSYEVHGANTYVEGATYTFCGDPGAPTLDVILRSGQVSCGF